MTILSKFFVIVISFLCVHSVSHSQTVFEIYQDDSLSRYFNSKSEKSESYYNGAKSLKDSLPDGIYLFYDVNKKDSLSKKKNILVQGEYLQNVKNGLFQSNSYTYNKKKKAFVLIYRYQVSFSMGVKDGVEEEYKLHYTNDTHHFLPLFYCIYADGKKNGYEIEYYLGYPSKISLFSSGNLKSETIIPIKEHRE